MSVGQASDPDEVCAESTADSTEEKQPEKSRRLGRSSQTIWIWIAVGLVVFLVAVVSMWSIVFRPPLEGSRTVGQAISEMDKPEEEKNSLAESVPTNHPAYRLVELASVLGMPVSAIPQSALVVGIDRDDNRVYLEMLLYNEVSRGGLTQEEAEGVLKSFDAGYIDVPGGVSQEMGSVDDEDDQEESTVPY